MGIAALPASTIRVLGSTQCLTDPASLVKELVENALDANATAIFVEISFDTLSKIKVKDNGHGVAPGDRSLVCKPHCTSKIRSFADLQGLGGDSLGFRGEALASAAELSDKIVLTTRVEGEPTAVEIHYDQGGSISKEKNTSHAVGTSIEVGKFLSTFPVRKQSVEKASSKILPKIKKLLQAYALARSRVRFSLRVLRAKNEKGDFSHCPKSGAKDDVSFKSCSLEAATNVFGRRAAELLQPNITVWSPSGELTAPTNTDLLNPEARLDENFILESLSVNGNVSDMQSINRLGQYISIDSRPVSCTRGVMKSISHHYRDRLRSICGGENGRIFDPLLVLNIRCPKGSYDVNVDPAKDEVLFTDTETIRKIFDHFLDSIYGARKDGPEATSDLSPTPDSNDYDLLFARKLTERDMSLSKPPSLPDESESTAPGFRTQMDGPLDTTDTVRANEYELTMADGRSDKDLEVRQTFPAFNHDRAKSIIEQEDFQDVSVSNPWSLAKHHTPLRRPGRPAENQQINLANGYLPTPQQQQGDVTNEAELTTHQVLPISSPSPVPFPYPITAFGKRHAEDLGDDSLESDQFDTRCGPLNSWLNSSGNEIGVERSIHGALEIPRANYPPASPGATNTTSIDGTALHDIPALSQRSTFQLCAGKQRPNMIATSSNKARNGPEDVWFPVEEHGRSYRSTNGSSRDKARRNSINLRSQSDNLESPPTHAHPDLANALDYEVRKVKATRDYREQLRKEQAASVARQRAGVAKQSTLDAIFVSHAPARDDNSPHRNRQRKAVAALHSGIGTPHDDSTAEMAASRYAKSGASPQRRPTKKLPLEEVDKHDWLADLVLPLSMTAAEIQDMMQAATDWDDYAFSGECTNDGFDQPSTGLLKIWELRLRQLVGQQYRQGDAHVEDGNLLDDDEFGLDLCQVLLTSKGDA